MSFTASTPAQIEYFRLASLKYQLRLEAKGLRSSGGAIRPRIAAVYGLKPRAPHAAYIAAIEAQLEALRGFSTAEAEAARSVHRVVGLGGYQVYIKTDGTLRYRVGDAGDGIPRNWATFAGVPAEHRPGVQRVIDAFHIVTAAMPAQLDAYPWAADALLTIDESV